MGSIRWCESRDRWRSTGVHPIFDGGFGGRSIYVPVKLGKKRPATAVETVEEHALCSHYCGRDRSIVIAPTFFSSDLAGTGRARWHRVPHERPAPKSFDGRDATRYAYELADHSEPSNFGLSDRRRFAAQRL